MASPVVDQLRHEKAVLDLRTHILADHRLPDGRVPRLPEIATVADLVLLHEELHGVFEEEA